MGVNSIRNILFLLFTALASLISYGHCQPLGALQSLSLEWDNTPDPEIFKKINVDAVEGNYKQIPQDLLSLGDHIDIKAWIEASASNWLRDLREPGTFFRLLTAKINGAPVGYAIFDYSRAPHSLYLAELVVDPAFQRQGIGKQLVFFPLEEIPELKKIFLITRKANFLASSFYSSIGFKKSAFMQQGYDPAHYIGFEWEAPVIAVGSTNAVKIEAVEETIKDYPQLAAAKIVSIAVPSGISDQPMSLKETITGAKNRARNAYAAGRHTYGIGIESGLVEAPGTKSGYLEACICAIYDGTDDYIGLSCGFEIPSPILRFVLEENMELGKACYESGITANPKLGAGEGLIGILSKGRINRKGYTKQCILTALLQLENSSWYKGAP